MQSITLQSVVRVVMLAVLAFATCASIGCGNPRMQSFNIDVDVRESVDRSFTIDLVGIRPADDHVKNVAVSEYFDPRRAFRADLFESSVPPVTHTFSAGDHGVTRVMEHNHENWGKWREGDVMELMVIVDRLGSRTSSDYEVGGGDTRRLIIPLDHRKWSGKGNTITIDAQRTRLTYSPQPDALD